MLLEARPAARAKHADQLCHAPALICLCLLLPWLHAGQLDRVVVPPCINLAPSGAPSNAPLPTGVRQRAAAGSKQRKMRAGGGGGGKGRGSKGGIGMKSCESFVASPAAPDSSGGLVAFLGDGGHIGLVSLAGRSSIGSLKMNGSARAAAFSRDGRTLITAGASMPARGNMRVCQGAWGIASLTRRDNFQQSLRPTGSAVFSARYINYQNLFCCLTAMSVAFAAG